MPYLIQQKSPRSVLVSAVALSLLLAAPFAGAGDPPGAEPVPAVAPAAAPEAAVAPAANAQQFWQGQIDLQAAKLDFVTRFTPGAEGQPTTGSIDIPMQGINGAMLKDITLTAPKAAEGGGEAAASPGGMVFTFTFPGAPDAVFTMVLDAADANKATGTIAQMGQSFPVTMSRLKEGEAPKGPDRPQHPRPPFPYEVGEMKFPGGKDAEGKEISLAGTITLPKEGGPFPGVILVSGSGPQDRDETLLGHKPFFVLADALTRAGIAVLRYDDRGVGASTGTFETASTDDFVDDAAAALKALAVQPNIDPKRVGIIGHSEGGLIAPIVAARTEGVAFLVLMAGTGLNGKDTLKSQLAAIQRAGGMPEEMIAAMTEAQQSLLQLVIDNAAPEQVSGAMRKLMAMQQGVVAPTPEQIASIPEEMVQNGLSGLNSPWMKRFLVLDPRESLRKITAPVLAINGELDTQVIASIHLPEIGKALDEAGNKDVTTLGVNGVNHLFQTATTGSPTEYASITETINPGVLTKITSWVRQRTGLEPMPAPSEPKPAAEPPAAPGAAPGGEPEPVKLPEKKGEGD
ncbi:MAG: alpha/beta hydrolase family protein [Phycisphaerales bacterium]